jgi:hypothetical protein
VVLILIILLFLPSSSLFSLLAENSIISELYVIK